MGFNESFENLCSRVAEMGREEVMEEIINFNGRIHLDFTESYLDSLSIDKLRHILLAALVVDAEKARQNSGISS